MKKWFVLACAVALSWNTLPAQVEAAADIPVPEEDVAYDLDAISFAVPGSSQSRLDVFVQVSYENLAFVLKDDQYTASYEMTIAVHDSTQRLVSEKLWTENVKATSFDESVSPQAHSLSQRSFELAPGKYYINTILRDNETKIAKRLVREIRVPEFAHQQFALSDIMLVRKITTSGERRSIVPSVSPNVGNLTDGFYLFFEAYNEIKEDSIKFRSVVLDEKKEVKLTVDTVQWIAMGRNQVFVKMDNSQLPIGDYTVFVQPFLVKGDSLVTSTSLATTSRAFVIRWRGLPRGVNSLDVAVEQLSYIAKEKELDHIKEAKTPEEKQRRFIEFWKTKDTNPNTTRNEKMEEHYARVEYANKQFKHYVDGWRTDMGMVYIMFGSPNNVDRHPFDIDSKPYEVWSYYDINHQFIFIDETGFGDYRLTTPIWDIWQRRGN
ncbi:MAG: GWxTD domain-containing protein [Bacteroidota bacterium]